MSASVGGPDVDGRGSFASSPASADRFGSAGVSAFVGGPDVDGRGSFASSPASAGGFVCRADAVSTGGDSGGATLPFFPARLRRLRARFSFYAGPCLAQPRPPRLGEVPMRPLHRLQHGL